MKEIHFEKTGGADFPKKQATDTTQTKLSNISSTEIGDLLRKKPTAFEPIPGFKPNMEPAPLLRSHEEIKAEIEKQEQAKKLSEELKKIPVVLPQREATQAEKDAKSQLDSKISSTGMKYSDAEKTIEEIRKNYPDAFVEVKEYKSGTYQEVTKFDLTKLPAEIREKYQNAVASKQEIENTNAALKKQAGILVENTPTDDTFGKLDIKPGDLDSGELTKILDVDSKPREATQEEKNAKGKLDGKTSSIGMKYSDAEKAIEEIRKNYPNAFVEVEEEQKQPENMMVYYPPIKVKKFDPNKLPAEVREKYQDAIATKQEVENNNKALKEQAGILVTDMPSDIPLINKNKYFTDNTSFNGGINRKSPFDATEGVTPRQQKARANMNEKVSSTGIKYLDAQKTISEITAKYENDEKYQSEFSLKQDPTFAIERPPVKKFDPYKLPEPDKTKYFEALESVTELEETNSALMQQTGWVNTKKPQILPLPNEFIKL